MTDPIKILLVDDDATDYQSIADVMVSMPGPNSYVVEWAGTYDAGLTQLLTGDYAVALLDYGLGTRDGLSLMKEAFAQGVSTPVILLTGHSDAALERAALAAGASDYLIKAQFTLAALERTIRHSIERGRTIAELRASERRYRALFDQNMDAILVAAGDGRYVDANPAALRLLGYTRDELLSRSITDITPVASAFVLGASQAFLDARTAAGEHAVVTASGDRRLIEYSAVANVMPGQHIVVLRDLTDRRRAEGQRVRLEAIIEAADDAIDGTDEHGRINYWSLGAERLYGHTADEVLGLTPEMLVPAEQRDELASNLQRVRAGETLRNLESMRRRKDGSLFQASISMAPITVQGQVVGVSAVTRDISHKKDLERQLAISDRMVSIGTLAAGVAHEINNPLAAVVANLELLEEEIDKAPSVESASVDELLGEARNGAERIRTIVRDLKVLSRPDDERRTEIVVGKVLDSAVRMAWNEIRHRARLVRDFREVPRVWGNDARLGQVILNLLVNAAHSIREGDAAGNRITLLTETDDSGRAVIEVHDTGCGILPEHLTDLFQPFFTTKPIGMGTGLGLPICQRIVHEMGGTIDVESTVGRGSRFRLTLPAAKSSPPEIEPPPSPMPSATKRANLGRLLVVDDDPMILKVVQRILGRDHDVCTVQGGDEAERLIAQGSRFDVILCDLMMPQMTGMELHARLTEIAPSQAEVMIFLTGGAFSEAAAAFLDRIPKIRIDKPFASPHLRAVVRDRIAYQQLRQSST